MNSPNSSQYAMGNTKDPITPRRGTSVSSLIETGRDSIWSLVAEFPSLVRTDPVKSKTKNLSTFTRSTIDQPRRPPPLHPKSLFLFNDHSFLPHLDDLSDGFPSPLPSSARTISSFAATASVRSSWCSQPAKYSIAEEEEGSARNDSLIALYVEQSRWSSDSESDDEDESPLSPTFLESRNKRRERPDMTARPSSPFIDPLLDTICPPMRGRRFSVLSPPSPLSSPGQSKIASPDKSRKPKPLRPIGFQALPQSQQNPDGSWKLIDAYGKTYNIPALSSPPSDLFKPSNVFNTKSENRGPGQKATEDVRTQFRQWQGFTPKVQAAA